MLNLPNLLTLFRILLVPLLVVVLLTEVNGKEPIALGVFVIASLTDFLDGFLARRRRQITNLGKLLDPAADKILTSAAFISLVGLDRAPAWIVVVIVAREFAVSTLRSIAAAQNVVVAASFSGKLKTVTQIFAISIAIGAGMLGETWRWLLPASLWAALIATVYSGIEYFVRLGRRVLIDTPGAEPGAA
jgi:CDP-diacylglycerol--glycerol-3-phosphate 3-phosphatidyltransferase